MDTPFREDSSGIGPDCEHHILNFNSPSVAWLADLHCHVRMVRTANIGLFAMI
jgi:hypothetical protein